MASDPISTAETTIPEAVTDADLIAALLAAATDDSAAAGGMTTAELVMATGRSDKWVRRRLWQLRRDSRLCRRYGLRESLSGSLILVPVYSIAEPPAAEGE